MPTYEDKRYLHMIATTAGWAANDIALADGEIGIEDLGSGVIKIKAGNGTAAWSELQYIRGWTQSEIEQIVTDTIASLGVAISTGADDAGKIIRADSDGLIDDSFLPSSITDITNYFGRYLGHLNARDDDVDTSLGVGFVFQAGDYFVMNRTGTYDASWPGIGSTAGFDKDLCIYQSVIAAFEIANDDRMLDYVTP